MSLDVSVPFSLEGRTAIVTGASSGLGERFARVLHAAGCTVIVGARRRERLDGLAADLGDRTALHAAALEAGGGHIDVLVNNAGIGAPIAAEIEDPATFRGVFDVNVTGVFVLSQLCARTMLEQGSGSIVNIASILGMVAAAPIMQASYCASKGAVVNLTRELACQWARRGVRVNAIAPGWFPSEMTNDEMFGTEEGMRFLRRNCPMGRGGEEHELDGVLLFLASDASSYLTGQTIAVDGGWVAR
jgi:NAD(P)-dependent dehydrogenase (short-subunit alcohol dehydrogenase family)